MDKKLLDTNSIVLDGRMDEPIWDTVPAYTNFVKMLNEGGGLAKEQTYFKIIPCEDKIYLGVTCLEPDMEATLRHKNHMNAWGNCAIEIFISPTGNPKAFYQFFFSISGVTLYNYYEEGGTIRPDRYAPDLQYAMHFAEDRWSVEIEMPLTVFYPTPNAYWSDKWLMNVARTRRYELPGTTSLGVCYSSWQQLSRCFLEPECMGEIVDMPMRALKDDVYITSATTDMTSRVANGYCGQMTVQAKIATAGTYTFISDHAEPVTLELQEGANEFVAPCFFEECGRTKVALSLKRVSDGCSYKRYYPISVEYEPIKLVFTLPEYRNNFYPGQDASKIVGKVIARKEVTLKLEGPGIETTVISPSADGSFQFDTPNFAYGDAYITATTEDLTLKKKIRRLEPTGKMMAWISGGNLIVNGEPVLRRGMYSAYYNIGEAFKRIYNAENLHETRWVRSQLCRNLQPGNLYPECERPGGEATKDQMPSEKMLRTYDELIAESNAKGDFVYYYLSDEPECRGLSTIYFKNLYNYIAEKDPYHVILIGTRAANQCVDFGDWFEVHPYLNPLVLPDGTRIYDRPMHTLGTYIDSLVKMNRSDKTIGYLATCFAYITANGFADYLTFDELNTHIWATMIHGGKSLFPYAGHDLNDRPALHEGMRYVFSSFEALEKLVLLGERSDLIKNNDVHAVLYDLGDEQMFVLVNMTQEPQTVTLDGLSGCWYNFRNGGTITENTFALKPLQTVIGTSQIKDTGLPSYAETVELIDKLEYERTHGGSLLFNRQNDITVTASTHNGAKHKMFDGMKNNFAWRCHSKEPFYEIDLTKIKPTFNKIVIGGYDIADIDVKLRINGELYTPQIAKEETEEFSKTILLKEKVSPDCLRLEFHPQMNNLELYEIEVF